MDVPKMGAILLVTFSIIFIYSIYSTTNTYDACDEYCQDKGYEGFTFNNYACYKEVSHESGLGTDRVYSGEVWELCRDG